MNRRSLLVAGLFLGAVSLGLGPARADEGFRAAPDLPFAIEHLALDLDVDLAGKSASGSAALDVKAIRDLAAIELDGVGLAVSGVTVGLGNDKKPAPFSADGEHLIVRTPLHRGDSARVIVSYAVHDPRAGLHFFGPTAQEPGVPLQVWSQGEARTNRYWFPCVDSPCTKQTSEVTVRVPQGFEALSNGALLERKDEAGKTTFHWSEKRPHVSYLISLVVGKFFVGKEEWRGRPVLFYVPERHKDDVARSFGETRNMLDFFSDKIGVEYPWEKYSQAVVEQFGHGGMENVSATTLNDYTLHDARAHLDMDSDGLVSHELAHQWWGDLLTCRDWSHIWLNEGFASYFEALWDEHKNGPAAFDYNMLGKSGGARDATCKARPVVDHHYADAESIFDSRAYPKGAWVLHGLRRRVGDDAFWRAIGRYAKAHLYGVVETVDLRRAFEEETGESLERYFYELTERPGHPALDVTYEWRETDKVLEVTVRQTQAGDAFQVRTALAVAEGKPGEARRVPFAMEDKERRLVIPLAQRPRFVSFDPDQSVLADLVEHKGEDQWFVQLAEDPRPVGRIRAAEALVDMRSWRAAELVGKQLLDDPFFGASVECANALRRLGGDGARDALLRGVAHAHPKVRRACVDALGTFRKDDKVVAALRAVIDKGDPSYFVEASATGAYAQVAAPDARAVLEKQLAKPSHDDAIAERAISGLASLEDPTVLPLLEKVAAEPGTVRLRRSAISALGRVGALPSLGDEARQKVVARLQRIVEEEGMRLRWSAVDALGSLGKEATRALPALDSVALHDGEGRLRDAAKAAAERIRAGTPPDKELARVREELQRVKDEEEKLLRRLERVEAKGAPEPAKAAEPAGKAAEPRPSEPAKPAPRQPD